MLLHKRLDHDRNENVHCHNISSLTIPRFITGHVVVGLCLTTTPKGLILSSESENERKKGEALLL